MNELFVPLVVGCAVAIVSGLLVVLSRRPVHAVVALLEDVADRSHCPVFAAGGITSIQDLRALEHRGLAGAVLEAEQLLGGSIDGRDVAREFGA